MWTESIDEEITVKKRFSCALIIKANDMKQHPPRKVKRKNASTHQWLHQVGRYEILAVEFYCTEGEPIWDNTKWWNRHSVGEDRHKRHSNYEIHRRLCRALLAEVSRIASMLKSELF